MENFINPCKCGSVEFITKPNRYDSYQIIDSKLEFIKSSFTEEETELFCRECAEKLAGSENFAQNL